MVDAAASVKHRSTEKPLGVVAIVRALARVGSQMCL